MPHKGRNTGIHRVAQSIDTLSVDMLNATDVLDCEAFTGQSGIIYRGYVGKSHLNYLLLH